MKGLPAIFEPVPTNVYEAIFDRLEQLRAQYPGLQDDQLLMFISCEIVMGVTRSEPLDWITK
jgi:hypothetical protein